MTEANMRRGIEKPPVMLRSAAGWVFLVMLAALTLPPAAADSCEDDAPAIGSDRDYSSGKLAAERQDWKHAIQHFERAARRYPENADIQSALGFAYHRAEKHELAFKHYKQALKLDRRHRSTHQYLGEAYLLNADLAGAEEHLNALRQICVLPCGELVSLEREVREYRAKATASRLQ